MNIRIKSFRDFSVNEGLIKVPQDLLRSLWRFVFSQYLSYMYSIERCSLDAIDLSKKYDIIIDEEFKPINKDIELSFVLDDLPERVKNSWRLEFGYLRFLIDWEQKIWGHRPKVNASYEESNDNGIPGYFTINPREFVELLNSDKYTIEGAIDLIERAKTSMWHEASHAIQHNSLKWLDKKQVHKSRVIRNNPESSPEDRRREYLSSAVEFDPQIKTKIFQFRKKYGGDKENIRKNLAGFVGAANMEGISPDDFFKALKQTDIRRWKKAVKLFYLNFGFDVSSLLKIIPVSK
jgi:hypothetical protein